MTEEADGASFRDPSGYVYRRDGVIYREINRSYASHYDQLMSSGLYEKLVSRRLLIAHEEISDRRSADGTPYLTIRPEKVAFISHPYEWSFSQLKDAARATLRVQREALDFGMALKDASAYNIQFHEGRPTLIDTLSFETYEEGRPWVAYRQFCQHFLAPLALMAYRDVRLGQLLRVHIDGIPLDLAWSLLPSRAWLNLHLLLHIRLHARYQRRYAVGATEVRHPVRPLSKRSLINLMAGIESAVKKLEWKPVGTEWVEYYAGDSYTDAAAEHKMEMLARHLDRVDPDEVWDLGANVGVFSRIASDRKIRTIAFDVDPACVDRNYRQVRSAGETRILPLLMDLVNPSPAIGWANGERSSLLERRSADLVMALALIHHLAISNNVPLQNLADFFARLAKHLIIEFVPKSDPKVQTLLASREDVFPGYTKQGFEAAFRGPFEIEDATPIRGSERTLYLMRRRAQAD